MAYYLYDVNGYVADCASITGLYQLRVAIEEDGNPHLVDFINAGTSLITHELISGLVKLAKKHKEGTDVRDIVDNMLEAIEKSELVIIISDGVHYTAEDEEEPGLMDHMEEE